MSRTMGTYGRIATISALLIGAGAVSADPGVVKAIDEIRKSNDFILVVGATEGKLTLGADIGPYLDALSQPGVQAMVDRQVSAMGGGMQAGAAGAVGAAIGGAIANAMIESDMREQARNAVQPVLAAMGEPHVGELVLAASKRMITEALGLSPRQASFRPDITGAMGIEVKFANQKNAIVMMVEPETVFSLDRNTIRTVTRISVARMKAGKRTLIVNCPIVHTSRSGDEATPSLAVERWRADGGKLAKQALVEAYEDSIRTFFSLTAPAPKDEELINFSLLHGRLLVGGRARVAAFSADRQVFESERCGATILHDARRLEL